MKNLINVTFLFFVVFFSNCSKERQEPQNEIYINPETHTIDEDEQDNLNGFAKDSMISVRPGSVLLTGFPKYRLTPVYKLNYNKKQKSYFTGYNHYYQNYPDPENAQGNQWNGNFMPGMQAMYGYNMINVSLYNVNTKKQKKVFDKPVLINTFYYPSLSKDTLNYEPVKRDFYIVSTYDEDTNKDGLINLKDLRRLYYFDLEAITKTELIPKNYSVISSQYDSANDYMYVYAQLDENKNGSRDKKENVHVFWIDLKNPSSKGRVY